MMRSSRASVVREIVDAGGLVLSEFPLGLKATHYTYPQRNRIVAGLSQCVYLPEAREGSGSLITVDFARAMSIPVYGAPQDMFADSSAGLGQAMQAGHVSPVVDIPSWLDSEF
jgi:DNA processing protein